ncbi:MAG: hypothetical protein HKP25_04265, partial [Marinicaulis sp.]|nr:hypothetical protein [Marinicaulis sp.]
MSLNVFSIVGEALNFGGRKMETIVRVAWLPVALLLILNMATVFAYVSVIEGRLITFGDAGSFARAERHLTQFALKGWSENASAMMQITGVSFILQAILLSSFMAPLIRYAGFGEKPAPGVVRAPFGPDQLRLLAAMLASAFTITALVLIPAAIASFFIVGYVLEIMNAVVVTFPNPESLHTIQLSSYGDSLVAQGLNWIGTIAIPLAAAAPLGLVFWLLLVMHFHPRNRPFAPEGGNFILRAILALIAAGGVSVGAYFLLRQQMAQNLGNFLRVNPDLVSSLAGTPVNALLFIFVIVYLIALYFNLRIAAYPGVVVCNRSMASAGTLKVSRGWNLIRLFVVFLTLGLFLSFVSFIINQHILAWIISSLGVLFQAAQVSTRLVNSGVTGEWVTPVFVSVWNAIKIFINIFWLFFTSGVIAGLYGRLFRESEREINVERKPRQREVWE